MRCRLRGSWRGIAGAAAVLALTFVPFRVSADTFTTGAAPVAVATNPATNKTYIVNRDGNSVTVIDGRTRTTRTVTVGAGPVALAINITANRIYVANAGGGSISVINGVDDTVTTPLVLAPSAFPQAIAIDPATNFVFAANAGADASAAGTLSIISGATNTVAKTLPVGKNPSAVAFNPAGSRIYVANATDSTVTIVNAVDFSIVTTAPVVPRPTAIAINPVKNKIYVTSSPQAPGRKVTVIDGKTDRRDTIDFDANVLALAVNPATGKVLAATSDGRLSTNNSDDSADDDLTVEAESKGGSGIAVGASPTAVAVNPVTNQVFVAVSGAIAIVKDKTLLTTVPVPSARALAVNPVTNIVVAANQTGSTASWIDVDTTLLPLTSQAPAKITIAQRALGGVAVNPATNRIYVTDATATAGTVTSIDGKSSAKTSITGRPGAGAVAIDPIANKVYVANNADNSVTVVDGKTNAPTTVSTGAGSGPAAIVVNPLTGRVFVMNRTGNSVTVINGRTNAVLTTIAVGTNPSAIAINDSTNRVYVANAGSANLSVINGSTLTETRVAVGTNPVGVGVNPETDRVYVANRDSNTITILNTLNDANTASTVNTAKPSGPVAVNRATNTVYIGADAAGGAGSVLVLNGATGAVTGTWAVAAPPNGLAVNPTRNLVYVAMPARPLSIFQGVTGNATGVPSSASLLASSSHQVAFNPVTNVAYDAYLDGSTGTVAVIRDLPTESEHITASVKALSGNVVLSQTQSLTISATSSKDYGRAIRNVYFQIDSASGTWTKAPASIGSWLSSVETLKPGLHVIYTFATDQEATADKANESSSPVVSKLTGYLFAVGAQPTVTSVTPNFGPVGGGTKITIDGSNFGPNARVTVGGADATEIKVVSSTRIAATTPAGTAGTAVVAISNGLGPSGASDPTAFTYGGCSLDLSPLGANPSPAGGSSTITIATQTGCAWTAVSNTTSFITVTGGASGSGNGTVTYSVASTSGPLRSGSITITVSFTVGGVPRTAVRVFGITQGTCAFTVAPLNREVSPGPGSDAGVTMTTTAAGCLWTATANAAWLHPTPSGAGNGVVAYTFDANDTDAIRTGQITVQGNIVQVTQAAPATTADRDAGANPVLSGNGRYIAFATAEALPVSTGESDGNGFSDIYVLDRVTNKRVRVSVGTAGIEGNKDSTQPAVSFNGRFVAFRSEASNLVDGDSNNFADIFLRDRDTDGNGVFDEPGKVSTTLVSVSSGGARAQGNSFSPTIGADSSFKRQGNDTRFRVLVAFSSDAPNLVVSDLNSRRDVFLALISQRVSRSGSGNQVTRGFSIRRVSTTAGGGSVNGDSDHPSLSPNGNFVAFDSAASNLVSGDTNALTDVFVRRIEDDDAFGPVLRVSLSATGQQAPAGSGSSTNPAVSNNGLVAFTSGAPLVPTDTNGKTDIYSRRITGGPTERESVNSKGEEANGASSGAAISANGSIVAFTSDAANLSSLLDTNDNTDVFVRDHDRQLLRLVSVPAADGAVRRSFDASLSDDGKTIVYSTEVVAAPPAPVDGSVEAADVVPGVTFAVSAPPPASLAFSPKNGPAHGTVNVQITGSNLTNAVVKFDGIVATVVPPATPNSIVVIPPDHAAGTVVVTVQAGAGSFPIGTFTYEAESKPACDFTLDGDNLLQPSTGGSLTARVQTESSCAWSAASHVEWLRIDPAPTASGSGSGTFQVTAEENIDPASRTGSVIVNGQQLSIKQAGAVVSDSGDGCPAPRVTLKRSSRQFDAAGGVSGDDIDIGVDIGCKWDATTDASWIDIPASGSESGPLTYTIAENTGRSDRFGHITVGGRVFSVTQVGAPDVTGQQPCSFTPLSANPIVFGTVKSERTITIQASASDCTWNAVISDAPWLTIVGAASKSGTGDLKIEAAGNSAPSRERRGSLAVGGNTLLVVQQGMAASVPFGLVDQPADGAVVSGTIALTGWALDGPCTSTNAQTCENASVKPGIAVLKIYREALADIPNDINAASTPCRAIEPGLLCNFIGDAIFVRGARSDIQELFPSLVDADRAGWGYLLLTNSLPDRSARTDRGGNGTIRLFFIAFDTQANAVEVGTKTLQVQNTGATLPFGAIDRPPQGATVGALSDNPDTPAVFNLEGWALTPNLNNTIPRDGSTIQVFVDSVPLGAAIYDIGRTDVAALFPGLTNSNGAGWALPFDSRLFPDGMHTVAFVATDTVTDTGAAAGSSGLGSRFFTIANATPSSAVSTGLAVSSSDVAVLPVSDTEVRVSRGVDGTPLPIRADRSGTRHIFLRVLDAVRLTFGPTAGTSLEGHVVNGDTLEPLPIGSALDATAGTFGWQLGPGFVGAYDLVFVRTSGGIRERIPVRIVVEPAADGSGAALSVDTPAADSGVDGSFTVAGRAQSGAARQLRDVLVYAYSRGGSSPAFAGRAAIDAVASDSALPFSGQFGQGRFSAEVEGLLPGTYDLLVIARSAIGHDLDASVWVRGVIVR